MFRISKSGYYDWSGRVPSKRVMENQALSSTIRDFYEDSFGSYGAPRIKAELRKRGHYISRHRVTRIMRANNLFAKRKRRLKITTYSEHCYPLARNILNQDFIVSRTNQVRVSNITYMETEQGWMYLTVIIDLFHHWKVVGWSMGQTLNTGDIIVPAWNRAVRSNNITKELIFHSDTGSQYASPTFTDILKRYNGSISKVWAEKTIVGTMRWPDHSSRA